MKYCICIISLVLIASCRATVDKAKDNGDIYVVSEEKFLREHQFIIEKEYITTEESIVSSTPSHIDANIIDFDRVIAICNSSFSIPMGKCFVANLRIYGRKMSECFKGKIKTG